MAEAERALTEAMDAFEVGQTSSRRDALACAHQKMASALFGLGNYQAARRHMDDAEALKRATAPSPAPDMASSARAGSGRISPLSSRELFPVVPDVEHAEMVTSVPASVRLLPWRELAPDRARPSSRKLLPGSTRAVAHAAQW